MNGLLIVFEGIDCCGKENQVARTRWWLADTTETKEVSQQVVIGREPTDEWSPIGRYIRSILQKRTPFPGNLELQRLFIVDRAQDLVCRIKPQLAQGIIRLQDRYALSTMAVTSSSMSMPGQASWLTTRKVCAGRGWSP